MDSNELYISLNGSRYKIFELDTIESIKIRLSANQEVKTKEGGVRKPLDRVPRPLLPNLIKLEETRVTDVSEHVVAGCKALSIKKAETEEDQINPLVGKKFQITNFYTEGSKRLALARLDVAKHRQAAEEMITQFELTGVKQYAFYAMTFIFGGLDAFNKIGDKSVTLAFMNAVEKALDFGLWDNFVIDYTGEQGTISREIRENIEASLKDLKLFRDFDEKLEGVYSETITSEIQYTKTHLVASFQIATDIYELFNGLRLSPTIPFVSVGNFYKVIKTFKPPKAWADRKGIPEDTMIIHVLNRNTEPEKNKIKADDKNYSPVFISPVSSDEKSHVTSIEMEIESRIDDELREENLLTRIFEAFPFPVQSCTYEQKRVEANYILPLPTDEETDEPVQLDIPLFFDMVMNDPLIAQLFVINESDITFRERGGVFCYFRYNSHVREKNFLSFHLNSGYVDAKQQSRSPRLFPELGMPYLYIKLEKCENQAEVKRLRKIINFVLEYYFEG